SLTRPTSAMMPPSTATSPVNRGLPVPSTRVPLRITRSCMSPSRRPEATRLRPYLRASIARPARLLGECGVASWDCAAPACCHHGAADRPRIALLPRRPDIVTGAGDGWEALVLVDAHVHAFPDRLALAVRARLN